MQFIVVEDAMGQWGKKQNEAMATVLIIKLQWVNADRDIQQPGGNKYHSHTTKPIKATQQGNSSH